MRPRIVRLVLGIVLVATPAALVVSPGVATGRAAATDDASVILDWERTAFLTVYGDPPPPLPEPQPAPRTPIPVGVLYLAFTSLAMNDAVEMTGHEHASPTAAAATAAHDVLVEYYPDSAPDLDARLDESLEGVHDGRAEDRGVVIGARAAAEMIDSRADDGRGDTSIVYSKPMEPGYWQPPATPPPGNMLAPWLGSVEPVVLKKLVRLNGPDRLRSKAYARDYNEVLELGSADSTERTPFQTETAVFYNSNSAIMVGEAVVDLLEQDPMSLPSTALLFARMHGSMADSVIKAWQLKRDVGFWRPFQAIAGWDTDGNPGTGPWPTPWVPLIANPPYSDYVSGHASLTAPAVQTVRMMLGEDTALTLHSYSLDTNRSYDDLSTIEHEAFHARIWGGLHFRDAMEDGYALGHRTARKVGNRIR
jgi:hypothetical protein